MTATALSCCYSLETQGSRETCNRVLCVMYRDVFSTTTTTTTTTTTALTTTTITTTTTTTNTAKVDEVVRFFQDVKILSTSPPGGTLSRGFRV